MRTDFHVSKLTDVAERYVIARDNHVALYKARNSGLVGISNGGPLALDGLMNGFGDDFVRIIGSDVSLPVLEGLAELANIALNRRRLLMSEDAKRV